MSRVAYPFVERNDVAKNLRAAVSNSQMSDREVAERAGVRPPHLSRFFRTGVGVGPDKIERIAKIIGVDVRKIYSPLS